MKKSFGTILILSTFLISSIAYGAAHIIRKDGKCVNTTHVSPGQKGGLGTCEQNGYETSISGSSPSRPKKEKKGKTIDGAKGPLTLP